MRRKIFNAWLLVLLIGTLNASLVYGWTLPALSSAVLSNSSPASTSGLKYAPVSQDSRGFALVADGEKAAQATTDAARSRILVGVWQPGVPWSMARLRSFEAMIDAKVDIVHWFQQWGNPDNKQFRLSQLRAVNQHGAIPFITWEPWDNTKGLVQPKYKLKRIIEGNFDGYIRRWARGFKEFGRPVFLRFAHEMNHPHTPWAVGVNGNTPWDYKRAWRHVHDIFVQEGATNVLWVWAPNVGYVGTTPYKRIYPGDYYVDWMGLTGYNGGAALPWGGWLGFRQIFGISYWKLTNLSSKPIIIAEVASVEQGGNKARWITNMISVQLGGGKFPRIRAFVWFNEDREVDWRINSSQAALNAFINSVKKLRN